MYAGQEPPQPAWREEWLTSLLYSWVGVVGRVGVGEVWNRTDIRWQRGGVNVDLVINVTSSRPGPVMMSIIHIYL